MKKLLVMMLVVCPMFAMAGDRGLFGMPPKENTFGYNFVEVNLLHMDRHNLNGVRTSGSFSVVDNLSIIGSLTGGYRSYANQQSVTGGVAYHQKLFGTVLEATDFVLHVEAEVQRIEIERRNASNYTDTDAGIVAGGGLRNRLIDDVEVFGDFSVRTTGSTDPFVTLGGRFSILPDLHLQASLEVGDNDTFLTGVRYTF